MFSIDTDKWWFGKKNWFPFAQGAIFCLKLLISWYLGSTPPPPRMLAHHLQDYLGLLRCVFPTGYPSLEIHPFYLPAHPIPHLGGPFDLQKQRGRAKESQRCFFLLGSDGRGWFKLQFFSWIFFWQKLELEFGPLFSFGFHWSKTTMSTYPNKLSSGYLAWN